MQRDFWKEEWREVIFDDKISENEKFKISNYGRMLNCKNKNEFIVKKYFINGYQNLPLRQKHNGKLTSRYVHKLVAESFLKKKKRVLFV